MLKRFIICLIFCPIAAFAEDVCYADYKAKLDEPLRLHYGVAMLEGYCSTASARLELPERLAVDGWTLLTVVSVFDEAGLAEREENAGDFFLRY